MDRKLCGEENEKMRKKYETRFYELMKRCFENLDPKYEYDCYVVPTMAVVDHLWSSDPFMLENVPIDQEIVRKRLLDRLDGKKLDEFVEKRMKNGWGADIDIDAQELYWSLLTIDEYGEIFEDDRYYTVILDD